MSIYEPTGIKKLYHDTKRTAAKKWLSLFHPTQVAITGSQGKTNTTAIVTTLLNNLGPTIVTDTNLDTTFNVPITALNVRPNTKFIVWELGIDHPGEMGHHLEIAKPSIGIITGISPVHTDEEHMGSLETLISEKGKLIEVLPATGTAILNYDDENVRSMAPRTKAHISWYGTDKELCPVSVDLKTLEVNFEGTSALFTDRDEKKEFIVETGLIGVHHVYNLMAGYLVLKAVIKQGDVIERFKKMVKELKPLRGRMNIEQGPLETILLNDSLRANPESTKAGLETLEKMEHHTGRKFAVIGEMGELADPEAEHRKTGELLAHMHFDCVVCIGPLRKYTIESAIQHGVDKEKILYAKDVFDAADLLRGMLKPNDIWYLKGSLLRNYKRIVQLLNGEKVCCHAVMCPYSHCGYS